jgi:uncharacterized membrane protein YphA (DoxX/SURF4 family)
LTFKSKEKVDGSFLILLRLTLGFLFLLTAADNFNKGIFTVDGYKDLISYYISNNINNPFNLFAESVLIPFSNIFVYIQIVTEFFIAVSLIFGLFTRLGSIVGAFISINLLLLTLGAPGEWIWSYVLLIVGFLISAYYSTGKWFGIDFWLKSKLPENGSKVLLYKIIF